MEIKLEHKSNVGMWLICFFCLIGFSIASYNFLLPTSDISHTGGAELMMVTSLIIALLAVLLFFFRHLQARWERVSIYILIAILLLGSIFAACLLESWFLLAVLIAAFIGLLIQLFTR